MITTVAARPDSLEDGVERLAKKAVALPHERRMSLVWTNHAALSEQRVERLRAAFTGQLEASQVRLVQGETAPALRVAIEQTPTQIVFTASVPGDGSTSVAIEEVARATVGIDASVRNGVRLEKELLWQQEARILSAALLPIGGDGEKRLVVLTEENLLVYGGGPGNWKLENTKAWRAAAGAAFSARAIDCCDGVEPASGSVVAGAAVRSGCRGRFGNGVRERDDGVAERAIDGVAKLRSADVVAEERWYGLDGRGSLVAAQRGGGQGSSGRGVGIRGPDNFGQRRRQRRNGYCRRAKFEQREL